jgi:hypothetical protein
MNDDDTFVTPHHADTDESDPYAAVREAARSWKVMQDQRRGALMPEEGGYAPLVRDETDVEIRNRERLEQTEPSLPLGQPSVAEKLTGAVQKVGNTIKKAFVAPRSYVLQFDAVATLVNISENPLTAEEIRELQEQTKHGGVSVVPVASADVRVIREAAAAYALSGRALNKDGVLQLRVWARQIRDRAMLTSNLDFASLQAGGHQGLAGRTTRPAARSSWMRRASPWSSGEIRAKRSA